MRVKQRSLGARKLVCFNACSTIVALGYCFQLVDRNKKRAPHGRIGMGDTYMLLQLKSSSREQRVQACLKHDGFCMQKVAGVSIFSRTGGHRCTFGSSELSVEACLPPLSFSQQTQRRCYVCFRVVIITVPHSNLLNLLQPAQATRGGGDDRMRRNEVHRSLERNRAHLPHFRLRGALACVDFIPCAGVCRRLLSTGERSVRSDATCRGRSSTPANEIITGESGETTLRPEFAERFQFQNASDISFLSAFLFLLVGRMMRESPLGVILSFLQCISRGSSTP